MITAYWKSNKIFTGLSFLRTTSSRYRLERCKKLKLISETAANLPVRTLLHYRAKGLLLMEKVVKNFLRKFRAAETGSPTSHLWWLGELSLNCFVYATWAEANLLASTKLKAPISVG